MINEKWSNYRARRVYQYNEDDFSIKVLIFNKFFKLKFTSK